MSKINTVLIDFDGTLMDTNELIMNSWQHTFRVLRGKEEDPERIKKTFGEILDISVREFFPEVEPEEAVEVYRSYQLNYFSDDIHLFPGMMELIKKLKAAGYKVAVVTSRLRPTTMEGLEKFGLEKILDDIITVEDCSKHKPDPEPALVAMRRLGSKPEETLMIGDSRYDMACANRAGATSVLVDWAVALFDRAKEGDFKPDYILEKPEKLWDILDEA